MANGRNNTTSIKVCERDRKIRHAVHYQLNYNSFKTKKKFKFLENYSHELFSSYFIKLNYFFWKVIQNNFFI